MTSEPHQEPFVESSALADDPDNVAADYGRVGYGRLGRFTPLALALLLLGALVMIWWVQRDSQVPGPAPGSMTGEAAPDVSLTLLDGQELRLDDLRGQVVVLNFWASWCVPCRDEMPELQAFWDEARRNGEPTEVLGVGVRTDTDDKARKFVADGGFHYPIGRDTNTDRPGVGPIEAAFGIPGAYPATVVIRPDGTVDRYHLGPLNRAMLRLMVDEARAATTQPPG
jgi:cytochrome c biogenesis protein CcmG, thiol:disulfide interchange protein DsbE